MTDIFEPMIQTVTDFAKKDPRIQGLALAGSYITQTMDIHSDLDFVIIVDTPSIEDIMTYRYAILASFGTLLACFTGEHVGEPRLMIALYDEPLLHVDFKFTTLIDFKDRIENPVILYEANQCLTKLYQTTEVRSLEPNLQWIEDRFWVWIHYATTKILRGEYFEVIDFLAFLRRTVFGPLIQCEVGCQPRGVRRLEKDAPMYQKQLIETLASHDKAACTRALQAAITLYLQLREKKHDPKLIYKREAEHTARKFFETALNF